MNFSLTFIFFIWIIGFGILSFILKEKIYNYFLKIKLPQIIIFLTIATPLILIEEFLTCETPFFKCIIITYPAFIFFLIINYFIQKKLNLNYLYSSLIFGLIGWFNEFILVGRIYQLDLVTIILFSIIVIPIYSIIAIIPSFYNQQKNKKLNSLINNSLNKQNKP